MNSLLWWFAQTTVTTALMILFVLLACRFFRQRPAVQHLLRLAMLLLFLITLPYWSWAQTPTTPKVVVSEVVVDEKLERSSSIEKPRTIQYTLIDGSTGVPLQGLEVTIGAIAKSRAGDRSLTPVSSRIVGSTKSDSKGVVEVKIRDDETPFLKSASAGWFPMPTVFKVETDGDADGDTDTTIAVQRPGTPNPKGPTPQFVKLWQGTEVTGRLLWPDGSPATGVRLNMGVYINNQTWKERFGMDLTFYSFDHGDWPNWTGAVVTDDKGRFHVTVPPEDARLWFRVGTTALSFSAIHPPTINDATTQKLSKCVPFEYQIGGYSRSGLLRVDPLPADSGRHLQLGDLRLETGVHVGGRVLDSAGNGLFGVRLTTNGPHGPHSGRSATSGPGGNFEFLAIAPGTLTVHPDARLRDEKGQVNSRDVQAVFVDQSFTIPHTSVRHEISIRAVPHTEVVLHWIDRREDTSQPIAYYGAFRIRGQMLDANGQPTVYWTSETERVERDGKSLLVVKVPTSLLKPALILPADRKVTASYADSIGVTSGPGVVELGDLSAQVIRTIFGNEPRASKKLNSSTRDQDSDAAAQKTQKRKPSIVLNGAPDWLKSHRFPHTEFTFVRLRYDTPRMRWSTDYPDADLNLMKRIREQTSLNVPEESVVLDPADKKLKSYPFAYLSANGLWELSDDQVMGLRQYLDGGGFLMIDDSWGSAELENTFTQLKRVLPDQEAAALPLSHPLFHCVFDLKEAPQVCGIHYAISGKADGVSWERDDAKTVSYLGIQDVQKRLCVLICHNTDLADGWERVDDDAWYASEFSEKRAFPMAINVVFYALSASAGEKAATQ